MKHYEGMFILKSELDKAGIDKVLSQIQEAITKNNGVVEEVKEWGKTRLAYPVKKYKEGIYYLIHFSIVPDSIAKIKQNISLNDSILRALITVI